MGGQIEEKIKKELIFKTVELNSIKEILAVYLGLIYTDAECIMPEDLEYKLRQNESDKYVSIASSIEPKVLATIELQEIADLCVKLGGKQYTNLKDVYNIKFFIKALARENHQLKRKLKELEENATRTSNLGSSDTADI